jgi:anthranilate phosphoribosyltransferase
MGVYDAPLVSHWPGHGQAGVKRGLVDFTARTGPGRDLHERPHQVCEFPGRLFQSYELTPAQFGYTACDKSELVGGHRGERPDHTWISSPEKERAPRAGRLPQRRPGLYIVGKAESIAAGVVLAEELIDSGAAKAKLDEFILQSNK